jgi:hypothetical protein
MCVRNGRWEVGKGKNKIATQWGRRQGAKGKREEGVCNVRRPDEFVRILYFLISAIRNGQSCALGGRTSEGIGGAPGEASALRPPWKLCDKVLGTRGKHELTNNGHKRRSEQLSKRPIETRREDDEKLRALARFMRDETIVQARIPTEMKEPPPLKGNGKKGSGKKAATRSAGSSMVTRSQDACLAGLTRGVIRLRQTDTCVPQRHPSKS